MATISRLLFFLVLPMTSLFAQSLPDSTQQHLETMSGTEERVNHLLTLSRAQYNKNPELTVGFLKAALSYLEETKDTTRLASNYIRLGRSLYELGQYKEALDYHLQAHDMYEALDDAPGRSDALNELGTMYDILGQSEKALKSLEASLALRQQLQDSSRISESYNNLGVYYYYQNNYPAALGNYRAAVQAIPATLTEAEKATMLCAYYNNIGEIYLLQGRYREAEPYFESSIEISRQQGNLRMTSMTLMNIAQLYGENAQPQRALALLQESGHLADSIDNRLLLRDIYTLQIRFYKATNQMDSALLRYEQLVAVKDSIFNRDHLREIAEMNTRYETAQQKQRIAALEVEKKQARILRNSLLAIALLGLGLAGTLAYTLPRIRRVNGQLAEKNLAIEDQRDEIQQQADNLQDLHEKLVARHEEVSLQKRQIEDKQRSITDSIRYASQIQQVMLPPQDLLHIPFADSFIFFSPKDIVSGDFYWFDEVNGQYMVVVADCTGHGVPGAFMTMLGHSILTELIHDQQLTDPAEILTELDAKITQAISSQPSPDGLSMHDGMDMVLLAYHPASGTLRHAGAKNSWFHLRGNVITEFRGSRYPIGSAQWAKNKVFSTETMQVQAGDRLFLASDGFQDQFGGGQELRKYLKKRVREWLVLHHDQPLPELQQAMVAEFEHWKGDQPQTDDVLVVGLEV